MTVTNSVPDPGRFAGPEQADSAEAPCLFRDLLLDEPGLLGFIARFLEQHAGHDWVLIETQGTGRYGIFCHDCCGGRIYRPDVAEARTISLLQFIEGR